MERLGRVLGALGCDFWGCGALLGALGWVLWALGRSWGVLGGLGAVLGRSRGRGGRSRNDRGTIQEDRAGGCGVPGKGYRCLRKKRSSAKGRDHATPAPPISMFGKAARQRSGTCCEKKAHLSHGGTAVHHSSKHNIEIGGRGVACPRLLDEPFFRRHRTQHIPWCRVSVTVLAAVRR